MICNQLFLCLDISFKAVWFFVKDKIFENETSMTIDCVLMIKGLLTERDVCTVKYRTEVFSTNRARAASEVCTKNQFTAETEQARSIN